MKKTPKSELTDDMRPEYDFRGGIRAKYAERYRRGTNIVVLDSDVAAQFKTSRAVNTALRRILKARGSKRRTA